MTRGSFSLAALILSLVFPTALLADIIDFEAFSDSAVVTAVNTATNTVTFSILNPNTGSSGPAYGAQVGAPATAFTPDDTPIDLTNAGRMFLTDELVVLPAIPSHCYSYQMVFKKTITALELDLYDYQEPIGGQAILTVFSDLFTTPVTSVAYTVVAGLPDGYVHHFEVSSPASIKSASLIFTIKSKGTGIDNVELTMCLCRPLFSSSAPAFWPWWRGGGQERGKDISFREDLRDRVISGLVSFASCTPQ